MFLIRSISNSAIWDKAAIIHCTVDFIGRLTEKYFCWSKIFGELRPQVVQEKSTCQVIAWTRTISTLLSKPAEIRTH
jgi:hypothetical protein